MKLKFRTLLVAAVALGLFFSAAAGPVDAQGKKPKRTRSSKPVVTVPPASADAAIISRASDFPAGDVELVPVEPIKQSVAEAAKTSDDGSKSIEELALRIKELEAKSNNKDPDGKQKRLLLNLDILSRAEQRSDSLRKQYFEMVDKENTVKTRLELIENDIRPEAIERQVAFAGSLRPEELRASRKKSLEIERSNLQNLLNEIQRTKTSLDQNVQKADAMVEKLRNKLEKDIDTALTDDIDN